LTRKAIEITKGTDTVALQLCFEQIYPPRKDRAPTICRQSLDMYIQHTFTCRQLVIERHYLLSCDFLAFLAPVKLKCSLHHVQYDYASVFVVHLIDIGVAKNTGPQIFTDDTLFFISY
jgi:hypothetical protein